MTVIDTPTSTTAPLRLVTFDLYRDIHKGIRSELFALTEQAGHLDPSIRDDRADLAANVRRVAEVLVDHALHEDEGIQPAMELHLPALAEQVDDDHHVLEARIEGLVGMSSEAVDTTGNVRWHVQRLYVELASFTSAYLAHQDLEERVIMPALEDVLGVDAIVGIHHSIIGSIPPEKMAQSLAFMIPAMNIDDRTELLGGMQAGAPAEVFAGVWGLVGSVLTPADHAALGARLGL